MWSSSARSPPLTGPSGPSSVLPTALTVTSSNAMPGVFSVRYASPTFGSAGMIIAAGPSLPTSQVPSLVTIAPSSKSATSSPKYQTDPSSAWAYRSYATSWMRPSRYAVYWETSVSTCWPCHSMILVSGSSVTSVRNGLPSTWPSIRTDSCFATGISPGTTGWGILLDPTSTAVDVVGLAAFSDVGSASHAPTTARLAASASAATPRASGLACFPPIVPPLQSLPLARLRPVTAASFFLAAEISPGPATLAVYSVLLRSGSAGGISPL